MADDMCPCGKPSDMLVTRLEGPDKGCWRFFCFACFAEEASTDPHGKVEVRFKNEAVYDKVKKFFPMPPSEDQ